jgi:hypothetical protein
MKTLIEIRSLGLRITDQTSREEIKALAARYPQIAKLLANLSDNGKKDKDKQ